MKNLNVNLFCSKLIVTRMAFHISLCGITSATSCIKNAIKKVLNYASNTTIQIQKVRYITVAHSHTYYRCKIILYLVYIFPLFIAEIFLA